MENDIAILTSKAARAETLRLFLDYDGTLADFAPTPDIILPNDEVIDLLRRLVLAHRVLPAVISGRRLAHIQKLLPVSGLLIAGTYGVEMQLPNGQLRLGLPFELARPALEQLLPRWRALITDRDGFYLEDKGWSLALHGRYATDEAAQAVIKSAVVEAEAVIQAATASAQGSELEARFQLLGGERFLEIAPQIANKATAVQWVLQEMTPDDALIIYLGDDDKDEAAFEALLEVGGYAVRVSAEPVETRAQFRLEGPTHVRAWLNELLVARGA